MTVRGVPFPFTVEGDPMLGAPAQLGLQLVAPPEGERFDRLRCAVTWFSDLGDLGGLGGRAVPPDRGSATLVPPGEPVVSGSRAVWSFEALAIDPDALAILANLIWMTGLEVNSAWLRAAGSSRHDALSTNAFPTAPPLPFAYDVSRPDRNVQLTVDFATDVPPGDASSICDAIRIWSLVGAIGGFRLPGTFHEEMDLIPESEPEIVLDQLDYSFRDNGFHGGALDVLAGVLARFHTSGVRIESVQIT